MAQVIKLTLALAFLFSFFLFISGLLQEGVQAGLYYSFFGFGSLIIPFLIFVLLYHWLVSKRFNYTNLWLRFIAQTFFITLISLVGLFIWAILEFMVTTSFRLDFSEIWQDYKTEYLGYLSIVGILALLVPPRHYILQSKRDRQTS